MTVALLPDAETVLVTWATANSDIIALVSGRVGTKLNGTLPAIRVTRIGDPPRDPWEDDANLQVECWAANSVAASLLVRTVLAALPTIRNTSVSGGRVYTYSIGSGPFYSPDDPNVSTNARYIFTVSLLITL